MKTGDKHYIVFTNDNEVSLEYSLSTIFRQDVRFIIERTFDRKSNGLKLFNYCKNQILDSDKNIVKENTFKWGELNCKIKENEYYGTFDYFLTEPKIKSLSLTIEVTDLLANKSDLTFDTHYYDKINSQYDFPNVIPFLKIKEDLSLLSRVGTIEGLFEIKKLRNEIDFLKGEITKIKNK